MTDLGIIQEEHEGRIIYALALANETANQASIRAFKMGAIKLSHKYDFIAREIDRLISRLDEMEG